MKTGQMLAGLLALFAVCSRADTFGPPGNEFTIPFVKVGNPGNPDDSGAGGGQYSSPHGGVAYIYRISVYEIPQYAIDKAMTAGLANVESGFWAGNQPIGNIRWFDAAAFVNWLNTSTGKQRAYKLSHNGAWSMELWSEAESWDNDPGPGVELNRYRHKDAAYFLPSEDEWYKAAFHKNDGVTANYWDYATESNSIPDGISFAGDPIFDVIFEQGYIQWIAVEVTKVGKRGPYGTFGQNGHMWEWFENAFDGVNDLPTEDRGVRGGDLDSSEFFIRSDFRRPDPPGGSYGHIGIRVASVPNDSDGDGFGDNFELTAQTDPASAASTPEGKARLHVKSPTEVEYRFNGASGATYRVEGSTNLRDWSTIEDGIVGPGGTIDRTYPISGPRFFRWHRN
jgi:hypothetical protein